MYAGVLVEVGAKQVDKVFTYLVPDKYKDDIKIGIRVKVYFGTRLVEGFVISISDSYELEYDLKEIVSIVDNEPILNEEMLKLGEDIANYTLCSKISAYQVMLPKALKAQNKTNINIKMKRYLVLNREEEKIINYIENCRYQSQIDLLTSILNERRLLITKLDSSINTLLKKDLIRIEEEENYRYDYNSDKEYKEIKLNKDQENVINCVDINNHNVYLLHGVTGSGKTEVYLRIIDKVIKINKTAIMLVPEISLTPQIVSRFKYKFGDDVAILHSGLSDSERYDEYRKIKDKKVKIVVGARSAVFAPLENIGVIIIDEEHVSSYKQENHPKYHAVYVATMRGIYHNCPVILGSATPSLESYARAKRGVYKLLELPSRANNGPMPEVTIVDMKKEIKKNNPIFSEILKNKIEDKLERNEQIILLLNRRGYSSMITCSNCGDVAKCPNCDISLTYHKSSGMLRCHYCGYGMVKPKVCSKCHSNDLKDYGIGTERLEEEIGKLFKARVVRMDLDTTSKKSAHEKIINDFSNHKYDILLGTQMIAKGLDFPLVTLVGVINADMSLNIPDFRSGERTFELLCQVSGRAGRSENPGEVIIQTYNEDHYSIILAKNHDYLSFYNTEMFIRRKLKYSPYYYITLVKISSKDYKKASVEANKVGEYLRKNLEKDTIVLGPTTSNMFKINNIYNYQCIIKYKKDDKLVNTLKIIDDRYKMESNINVEIDVNPIKL